MAVNGNAVVVVKGLEPRSVCRLSQGIKQTNIRTQQQYGQVLELLRRHSKPMEWEIQINSAAVGTLKEGTPRHNELSKAQMPSVSAGLVGDAFLHAPVT